MSRGRVVVREAVERDAWPVSVLGAVAFRESHRPIADSALIDAVVAQVYNEDRIRRAILGSHGVSGSVFVVACRLSKLVGFLEYDERGEEPELHRLYVHPRQQRTGIGSALLAALHDRLPVGRRYRVTVAAANSPALGFYEHHGFLQAGRATQHYPEIDLPPDVQPASVVFFCSPPIAERVGVGVAEPGCSNPEVEAAR